MGQRGVEDASCLRQAGRAQPPLSAGPEPFQVGSSRAFLPSLCPPFIHSWVVLFTWLIRRAGCDSSARGGSVVLFPAAPRGVGQCDVSDAASALHHMPPSTNRLPPPCQILIVLALNFCKAKFAKAPT